MKGRVVAAEVVVVVMVVRGSGWTAGGKGRGAEDLLREGGPVAAGHDVRRVEVIEVRVLEGFHGRDAAAGHKLQHFLQEPGGRQPH